MRRRTFVQWLALTKPGSWVLVFTVAVLGSAMVVGILALLGVAPEWWWAAALIFGYALAYGWWTVIRRG